MIFPTDTTHSHPTISQPGTFAGKAAWLGPELPAKAPLAAGALGKPLLHRAWCQSCFCWNQSRTTVG